MQLSINDCPVWITWVSKNEAAEWNKSAGLGTFEGDAIYTEGFYWAYCQPGCIPDSEFFGPFKTEEEAEKDATEVLSY